MVWLDLSRVDHIDTTALRLLLTLARMRSGPAAGCAWTGQLPGDRQLAICGITDALVNTPVRRATRRSA